LLAYNAAFAFFRESMAVVPVVDGYDVLNCFWLWEATAL
jgi:hypothetical protein